MYMHTAIFLVNHTRAIDQKSILSSLENLLFLEATFQRFVIHYSKTRVKRVYHRKAEKNRFNREVRYVVSLKNAII